ncbi:MAG: DUF4430 domain-containing protein [Isosphaeraceae bacterium]
MTSQTHFNIQKRFFALALVFTAISLVSGNQPLISAQEKPAEISLKIDFGDGLVWQFSRIEFKPKMTVMDAMEQLKNRKIQPLVFEHSGRGQNAFLKSIGGVANEGGGRSARNWFYRIGGKLGDRSFGIAELSPGQEVVWHFGKYMPEK